MPFHMGNFILGLSNRQLHSSDSPRAELPETQVNETDEEKMEAFEKLYQVCKYPVLWRIYGKVVLQCNGVSTSRPVASQAADCTEALIERETNIIEWERTWRFVVWGEFWKLDLSPGYLNEEEKSKLQTKKEEVVKAREKGMGSVGNTHSKEECVREYFCLVLDKHLKYVGGKGKIIEGFDDGESLFAPVLDRSNKAWELRRRGLKETLPFFLYGRYEVDGEQPETFFGFGAVSFGVNGGMRQVDTDSS